MIVLSIGLHAREKKSIGMMLKERVLTLKTSMLSFAMDYGMLSDM